MKIEGIGADVKLIRRKGKTITARVYPDGAVIARAPKSCPLPEIEAFLSANAKRLEDARLRQLKLRGEALREGIFTQEDLTEMKRRAGEIIPQRAAYYAEQIGADYRRITIRAQKTRWGSCCGDGSLNFNCLLTLAPGEVLDSVVIHELCHLKRRDHSPAFYAEVYKYMPKEQYDRCARWLKIQGAALLRRLPEKRHL